MFFDHTLLDRITGRLRVGSNSLALQDVEHAAVLAFANELALALAIALLHARWVGERSAQPRHGPAHRRRALPSVRRRGRLFLRSKLGKGGTRSEFDRLQQLSRPETVL